MVLLATSTLLTFLQFLLPSIPAFMGHKTASQIIRSLTVLSAMSIASSLFALIVAFIYSDLSYLNVALNSHQATELIYKIGGVWGNHEGSMLLWLVLLSLASSVLALQRNLPGVLQIQTLRLLGAVSLSFHLFVLLVSNPFVQLGQSPRQGMGLNPLLEDPSLVFHPPMLYTGLALLSVIFALGSVNLRVLIPLNLFAVLLKPWVLACWCCLTIGIALGSWWAYYELGWGGWWFWDPVENLSLLPWLVMTALVHALARPVSARLISGLAMGGFVLALLSLFLVRSGALSSVHAFALDPLRGSFLGIIALIFTAYAGWRLGSFKTVDTRDTPYIFSQGAFLSLNVYLMLALMAVILVGTLYPLVLLKVSGKMISVGSPYFITASAPFFLITLVLMILYPFIGRQQRLVSYLATVFLSCLVVIGYIKHGWPIVAAMVLSMSICLLLVTLWDAYQRRLNLTFKYVAMALAHSGVAIVVIGAVLDSYEKVEESFAIKMNDSRNFQGFQLTLNSVAEQNAPYFKRQVAQISVSGRGGNFTLQPERRFYPLHEIITTETDFRSVNFGDLYSVLSESSEDTWLVKLHWHPAIRLLWIGAALLVLAGLFGFISAYRKMRMDKIASLFAMFLYATSCQADTYTDVVRSLYCPTCEGQVLDESSTQTAVDMKLAIRRMLDQGKSPDEIRFHFASIYGEKVLLSPPWGQGTFLLWISPFLIFSGFCYLFIRRNRFLP